MCHVIHTVKARSARSSRRPGERPEAAWSNILHTGGKRPKAVEAVPSDVVDRPEHLSVTGRNRLLALETSLVAGGFPDDIVGVKCDNFFPLAYHVAATVGSDHGQV